MSVANIRKTTEEKMVKSIESLKTDLQKVRTGRAHTGILDHVQVDYYGSMVPISQVANLSLADARTIVVQPWEKNMANAVEKAIRESDLGLNPASMGETIRVPMPALTEERRRDLVKRCKQEIEVAKINIRNARQDGNNSIKKLKGDGVSEDAIKEAEDKIQKKTDAYIAKIDQVFNEKEKDIMSV